MKNKYNLLGLYSLLLFLVEKILPISKFFSAKMKLFVEGRKDVFRQIQTHINTEDRIIWLHAASLGEYEQGLPVLEELNTKFPEHKVLISFFSPSGFEVKKNNPLAHLTVYLPLDTKANARKFLEGVQPELVLFVKYEIWPNYLNEIGKRGIPCLLLSATFRENQIYFRWYGKFMKKALMHFNHLFVQNKSSYNVLINNYITNITLSGDTRFDRVYQQLAIDNHLRFMDDFKGNALCVVCGSTWPEDEELLIDFINNSKGIKIVIAPHEIKEARLKSLQAKIKKSCLLYTDIENKSVWDYEVLIVNTIGLLSRIYSYATVAYVGGAAGNTGLHNILEPATFGIPIVIGSNYAKFPEAEALKKHGGLFSVANSEQGIAIFKKLLDNSKYRDETGKNAANFIKNNTGATQKVVQYVTKTLEM